MLLKSYLKYFLIFNFLFGNAQNYSENGEYDFNFDWEFKLLKNTSIPSEKNAKLYKDWTPVNLPHDWAIHFSFDSKNGEGATGYLPGGMGVYKKGFDLKKNDSKTTYLLFDGVYNNSEVYLNGKSLGFHPYGYSPFYFDITNHLKEQDNQNEVRVTIDRSRYVDSRWYSGSGIYRNVSLIRKDNLHVPVWGVFITTPKISNSEATIHVKSTVKNNYNKDQNFVYQVKIINDSGKIVSESSDSKNMASGQEIIIEKDLTVPNPYLWGIESPRMYKAIISILKDDKLIDKNTVRFGVRKIKFDVNKGFFLNDVNTAIKGVCLHHDGGLVGAAVPKEVWKRRLQTLRDGGCNAIRISHNPGSNEFLDLCDEMGFLVQDEFFDEWDNPKDKRLNQNEQIVDSISRGYAQYFQKWAEKDLKNTMRSHRNHPSIFQWSIGNEIEWTYPRNQKATGFFDNISWQGNYFWEEPPYSTEKIKQKLETLPRGKYDIGKTAKKLAKWTREMDTTRYVTANCILPSSSHLSGFADALDVIGYSYRRVLYDYGHKNYPSIPIMGSENLPQWHEWKAIQERPFISGTFLWTGIDYMGESHKQWPRKATPSGMLDVGGFEKPSFHMLKTLWNKDPHIFVATQTLDKSIFKEDKKTGAPVERKPGAWKNALWVWHDVNEHWNYKEGEKIVVEVYSNYEELELCLNNESLGTKKLKNFEDRIYKWILPFKNGALKIIGKKEGKDDQVQTINTTGEAERIKLGTDKTVMTADGYSVAHIVAQLEDAKGNPIKNFEKEITFSLDGAVSLLGVDNGSAFNVQDYKSNAITTYKGRALLIIQSKLKPTNVKITASAKNIDSNTLEIIVH